MKLKRVYGIMFADYATAPYVGATLYKTVKEAYLAVKDQGFTKRIGPLTYAHNKHKSYTAEIQTFFIVEESL